jgi:hypothetical protein
MRKIVKMALLAAMAIALSLTALGCREADRVSRNVSVEADNFNVARRITVFNVRTDKVLWQMTGTFSVQHSDGDLDVIVELPNHTYAKHFFDMNEWTTYIIEDLSGTNVSKYSYELNFLPETLVPVTITSND